jgi:hypothetical protein
VDELVGYVDESNGPNGEPLSVAITVAHVGAWGDWGRAWLPKVEKLRGGYRGYKHKSLHSALAALMAEHTAFSSFITIREADYHDVFPKWVQSVIGGPYATGILFTLMTAAVWARENRKGRIFYFIEQGHRNFPYVELLMSVIMRSADTRELFGMAGWGPATKQDVPIHCPDTLAHNAAFHYRTGSYGEFIDTLHSAEKVWRGDFTREIAGQSLDQFKEVAKMFRRAMNEDREAMRHAKKGANKS